LPKSIKLERYKPAHYFFGLHPAKTGFLKNICKDTIH